jgi:hypothetical protein
VESYVVKQVAVPQVDSGLAVARQTARILIKNELLCDQIGQNVARIEYLKNTTF